jgi:hypothetical protein
MWTFFEKRGESESLSSRLAYSRSPPPPANFLSQLVDASSASPPAFPASDEAAAGHLPCCTLSFSYRNRRDLIGRREQARALLYRKASRSKKKKQTTSSSSSIDCLQGVPFFGDQVRFSPPFFFLVLFRRCHNGTRAPERNNWDPKGPRTGQKQRVRLRQYRSLDD